jgi:hypothetical protein
LAWREASLTEIDRGSEPSGSRIDMFRRDLDVAERAGRDPAKRGEPLRPAGIEAARSHGKKREGGGLRRFAPGFQRQRPSHPAEKIDRRSDDC